MRVLHHLVATAVALSWTAGCGTNHQDSRVVAATTPPSTRGATSADPLPDGVSLVLASRAGVDLMSHSGDLTRLSDGPAAAAFGIRDDLVVFQGGDEAVDGYPPRPGGPVEVWSEGTVRELPVDPGASSVLLLDAGVIDDRPVALVAERFGEGYPERAVEALVLIDLEDLVRRTVVPRQPAWESGHQAAHLRPDGDVVGLHRDGAQVHLVRWSPGGDRAWSVKVAEDRTVDLVASGSSVAVVEPSFDRRRGFAPILTVTGHDPATGEAGDPTVVHVADPEGAIGTGLRCRDWLTASELACARSGGAPVGVSVDGSFQELGGPPGAIPSVVGVTTH